MVAPSLDGLLDFRFKSLLRVFFSDFVMSTSWSLRTLEMNRSLENGLNCNDFKSAMHSKNSKEGLKVLESLKDLKILKILKYLNKNKI